MRMKIHPLAEIFGTVSETDVKILADDISINGLREAIWLHQDGSILDGRNRYRACEWAGIEPHYRTYEGEEALAFVISMNLARRHLNESQRAMVASRLANLKDGQKKSGAEIYAPSQAEAAHSLGVSRESTQFARKVQQHAAPSVARAVDAGHLAVSAAAKLADKPVDVQERVVARIEAGATSQEALKAENVHVSNNNGENEWYTPPKFIESARVVLGKIDLDPASSVIANKTVQADKIYTIDDDGLSQPWFGKIWCNPPYSSPEIKLFAKKFREERANYEAAIILVNNATETGWFNDLIHVASALCCPSSRVKFLDPQGNEGAPLQGQAIIYIGLNDSEFLKEFSQYGWVAVIR